MIVFLSVLNVTFLIFNIILLSTAKAQFRKLKSPQTTCKHQWELVSHTNEYWESERSYYGYCPKCEAEHRFQGKVAWDRAANITKLRKERGY